MPYFARGWKKSVICSRQSNRTDTSLPRIAHDAVRGYEAQDWAGEGHVWQDEPPIDCCVAGRFRLISRDDGRICRTAPVGRIVPIQANTALLMMRRAGSRRRAGRGRNWLAGRATKSIVKWVGFFALFRARMKNYIVRPPPLELNQFDQTPRRPGCGARFRRVGPAGGGTWPAGQDTD